MWRLNVSPCTIKLNQMKFKQVKNTFHNTEENVGSLREGTFSVAGWCPGFCKCLSPAQLLPRLHFRPHTQAHAIPQRPLCSCSSWPPCFTGTLISGLEKCCLKGHCSVVFLKALFTVFPDFLPFIISLLRNRNTLVGEDLTYDVLCPECWLH